LESDLVNTLGVDGLLTIKVEAVLGEVRSCSVRWGCSPSYLATLFCVVDDAVTSGLLGFGEVGPELSLFSLVRG
jgi:hypothetical protein